jgi:hypothetical protein
VGGGQRVGSGVLVDEGGGWVSEGVQHEVVMRGQCMQLQSQEPD